MSSTTEKTAELNIEGKIEKLPLVYGTSESDCGVDIQALLQKTGHVTFDPGLKNTAICKSSITYLDGEKGVLRYRGYPIEELAAKASFVEVAYLLIHNALPTAEELETFSALLNQHALIHEDMRHFFYNFPEHAHPMAILSAMTISLSTFYPKLQDATAEENIDIITARLLSKTRTLAAFSYKKSIGESFVYPRHDLKYCNNFLNMMFDSSIKPYKMKKSVVEAFNTFLILHADHEQNCSTSAVRLVGSAQVNLYAAISAGISALWGPLHGGANQAVMTMLEKINTDGTSITEVIRRAKDKKDPFKLSGFGHRVYKNYDPRAKILKKSYSKLCQELELDDPLFQIAMELEETVLKDDYFSERKLYPNVDFYSGLILRAIGIPENMFTVIFAMGRMPGWIAQWKESREDLNRKIYRPRQVYTGPAVREYKPLSERSCM